MGIEQVVVVGAGPGGLAVAAALGHRGIPSVVLERSDGVGASWRGHYDRLHLHTTRRLSGLPGMAIPRRFGRWVSRDDVVRYLEAYARRQGLEVRTGVEVTRIERAADGWAVRTAAGEELTTRTVVVATGYNHTPAPFDVPGVERFTGEILHASRYRNPEPFRGRRVLVVGIGNTGAEIAADLADGGAAQVWIAVRTPPHIVRRSILGWPAQATGILVRHLPVPVVDRMAQVLALSVPNLTAHGLPRPTSGMYTRVLAGSVPVQDVGLLDAVRTGRVQPVGAVAAVEGAEVVLVDGARLTPDVIVAATGYRRGLEPLVGHLGVLDQHGRPVALGGSPAAPGLYFTGYTNPISGMLRELRIDAVRIARAVAAGR
jgi:cation diffusion facilitator CzcD-associated flavoprotein CzcO